MKNVLTRKDRNMAILRRIYQYTIIAILMILVFYIPVILAARFWGAIGGVVVSLAAGLLGGPFLPDGLAQNHSQWVPRLCFYVVIGAFVGKLFSTLNQKNAQLLFQKQELEVVNKEITQQRDQISQQRNEIENKTKQIRQFYIELIDALAEAIEIRDSYTRGHCRRVSELSVRVGKRMGLDQRELFLLKGSSMLHDIGKIGIPEEILNKEGKLTEYEYEVMKKHPSLGAKILSGIPQTAGIIDGILHHHERMDGKGYPDGLMGEEIGLQARIITVCDTWDALTSKRSYRDAMSYHDALKIMESGRGTQFDPNVLDHFFDIVGEDDKSECST